MRAVAAGLALLVAWVGPAAAAPPPPTPLELLRTAAWIERRDDGRRLVVEADLLTRCLPGALGLVLARRYGLAGTGLMFEVRRDPASACDGPMRRRTLRHERAVAASDDYLDVLVTVRGRTHWIEGP